MTYMLGGIFLLGAVGITIWIATFVLTELT